MNEFEDDEESGFSLGGLPEDFGNPIPTASDSKNFPNIPGYRVTALLGQGGMGAVYQAPLRSKRSFYHVSRQLPGLTVNVLIVKENCSASLSIPT